MSGDFTSLSNCNRKVKLYREKVGKEALKYDCTLSLTFIPVCTRDIFRRRRYFTAIIKRANKLICFKWTSVSVNPNDQIKLFDRQSNC